MTPHESHSGTLQPVHRDTTWGGGPGHRPLPTALGPPASCQHNFLQEQPGALTPVQGPRGSLQQVCGTALSAPGDRLCPCPCLYQATQGLLWALLVSPSPVAPSPWAQGSAVPAPKPWEPTPARKWETSGGWTHARRCSTPGSVSQAGSATHRPARHMAAPGKHRAGREPTLRRQLCATAGDTPGWGRATGCSLCLEGAGGAGWMAAPSLIFLTCRRLPPGSEAGRKGHGAASCRAGTH